MSNDEPMDRASAATFLRRATLAPTEQHISTMTGRTQTEAAAVLLEAADAAFSDPDRMRQEMPAIDHWQDLLDWWVGRMTDSSNGVVDRLTWFWHTHLTTAANKAGREELVRRQLLLLRTHSLGSFRTMLHQFVVDGALLRYLDGDGSQASNPNENLARELMELFTVGHGHYSQDDVRAAARALAGWRVIDEKDEPLDVVFDRSRAFIAPLLFLGEQDEWDTVRVVDTLLDHPATARNVGSKLWYHFTGTELDEGSATDLGSWWQERDLEIRPLVERILLSDDVVDRSQRRPRTGLEWFVAMSAATGEPLQDPWRLESLGQMPYLPPNVAGWPEGEHWLRAGSLLARGDIVHGIELDERLLGQANTTLEVLRQCTIEDPSPSTLDAMARVDDFTDLSLDAKARNRWRLALSSPEFQLQ